MCIGTWTRCCLLFFASGRMDGLKGILNRIRLAMGGGGVRLLSLTVTLISIPTTATAARHPAVLCGALCDFHPWRDLTRASGILGGFLGGLGHVIEVSSAGASILPFSPELGFRTPKFHRSDYTVMVRRLTDQLSINLAIRSANCRSGRSPVSGYFHAGGPCFSTGKQG